MSEEVVGKRRPHGPTEKQILAAEGIARGVAHCQAMIDAGYSRSTAETQAHGVMAPIRALVRQAMERQGITLDVIMERLNAALFSVRQDAFGFVNEDTTNQLKAIERLAKMAGLDAPTETKNEHTHLNVEQIRREQTRLDEALDKWLK